MQITFLLGNGFDVNLGMNTKYPDFYKYYCRELSSNPLIESFKDDIKGNYSNWSDFELAFGQYCKNFKSREEFQIVFDDASEKLAEYIANEESQYNFEKDYKSVLYRDLTYPERVLSRADSEIIDSHKKRWAAYGWGINVISFNYSESLEKLLGNSSYVNLPKRNNGNSVALKTIRHIHGYTNKDMVLGVNDSSQITNDILSSDAEVLEAFVKSECNKIQKHLIDQDCKELINKSNLICLFGLSLGDTDKIWWEFIGERLKSNECRLIIFSKGDEIKPIHNWKKGSMERKIKQYFLSKTNLTTEEVEEVESRIYVGYNTGIFNIKLEKKII